MSKKVLSLAAVACAVVALTGCEATDMRMGSPDSKTVATGSVAGANPVNQNSQLQRCQSPLGTVSLVENQDAGWYTILRNEYRLPPTANLLRLMIQQSNCFVVVERSVSGMRAMDRERQIQGSGEMRGGSNMGKGQMVASDYAMSPEIIFTNSDAGGIGGVLGGILGGGRGRPIADTRGRIHVHTRSAAASAGPGLQHRHGRRLHGREDRERRACVSTRSRPQSDWAVGRADAGFAVALIVGGGSRDDQEPFDDSRAIPDASTP